MARIFYEYWNAYNWMILGQVGRQYVSSLKNILMLNECY